MEVNLKGKKLTTIGGSEGFIVDKAYIKNGQLEKDKGYDLSITPSEHQKPMNKRKAKLPGDEKEKFLNSLEE